MVSLCMNINTGLSAYIAQASQPPRVSGLPREGLCSLVLSNPDGHLLNHNMELLHWTMYVWGV